MTDYKDYKPQYDENGDEIFYDSHDGKTITALVILKGEESDYRPQDKLSMKFGDQEIHIFDDGQHCCETRYMVTDDKLEDFVGGTLVGFEVRSGDTTKDEDDGEHEIQFFVVKTSKGNLTLATHNEHNGYYSGFSVIMREVA